MFFRKHVTNSFTNKFLQTYINSKHPASISHKLIFELTVEEFDMTDVCCNAEYTMSHPKGLAVPVCRVKQTSEI